MEKVRTIDVVLQHTALSFATRFDDIQVPFQHVSEFRIERVLVPQRLQTHPFLLLHIPEIEDVHVMAANKGSGYCALYPRRIIGSTLALDPQSCYKPRQPLSYQTRLTVSLLDPNGTPLESQPGDFLVVHATMAFRDHVNYGY